jgi:hypothetical protein
VLVLTVPLAATIAALMTIVILAGTWRISPRRSQLPC